MPAVLSPKLLNSNKKSLALNTTGRPKVKGFWKKTDPNDADVLVENFGSGAMDRMGFTLGNTFRNSTRSSIYGFSQRASMISRHIRTLKVLRETVGRNGAWRRPRSTHRLLGRPPPTVNAPRRLGRQQ